MIKLNKLNKFYNRNRPNEIHVINDINLTLPESGLVVLLGPSGSGKRIPTRFGRDGHARALGVSRRPARRGDHFWVGGLDALLGGGDGRGFLSLLPGGEAPRSLQSGYLSVSDPPERCLAFGAFDTR